MGSHYTPQAHLRRFEIEEKPGLVWMYDKTTRDWKELPIIKVAQEPGYYDPGVEVALNEDIEIPGNRCIEKLIRQEHLTDIEREEAATYIMHMATRGPRQRRKSQALLPQLLDDVISKIRKEFEDCIEKDEKVANIAKQQLEQLNRLEEKYSGEIPSFALQQTRIPFLSERLVQAIFDMAWHLLPASPNMYFITSDTPAHFFDGHGIGTEDSEFTITLSKEMALIGEHRGSRGIWVEQSESKFTKEINRRLLSNTERFVFSPRYEQWIDVLCQKEKLFCSLIRWG